ncbi:spore coat protein [Metabacillus sp. KIGAM252]|uniref:Spore coat protein n=1 Tax=Metabacillus flavus TaxID=2823519 RepID=A0ABS5LI63_9BACI|nr:spore coat protein [Metabacillus flavus]MBS2970450.1 spore coat protein [Metabacillus flavus]
MNQNQNQQSGKIGNQETQVPKTPQMNERDFVNDLLATEKYMTDAYCTAMNEMSHESLYKDIQSIFNETQDCQRHLYNLMFKNGWYKVEAEQAQKMQQTHQQFSGYAQQQSPYGGLMQ